MEEIRTTVDILRQPSLEDLTRGELMALIRHKWGEPAPHEVADLVWQRMTATVDQLRENSVEQPGLTDAESFLVRLNHLDEARKLEAQATSYFYRWVIGAWPELGL